MPSYPNPFGLTPSRRAGLRHAGGRGRRRGLPTAVRDGVAASWSTATTPDWADAIAGLLARDVADVAAMSGGGGTRVDVPPGSTPSTRCWRPMTGDRRLRLQSPPAGRRNAVGLPRRLKIPPGAPLRVRA